MHRTGRRLLILILVMAVSAGWVTAHPAAAADAYPACLHPYPCGDEWPSGLQGPFPLAKVLHVRVPSFDGIELEGWIGLPAVPDGVRVPVALHSTPYYGYCSLNVFWGPSCDGSPADPRFWEDPPRQLGVPPIQVSGWGRVWPIEFVQRGYAAAYFSVRGTGLSGGCQDYFGDTEQKDQAFLVDWLGRQPWSNGRVGMGGVSYPGTTPLEAAIGNPSALKTIVVSGIVSDPYTFSHTPQGAKAGSAPLFQPGAFASTSLSPSLANGLPGGAVARASHLPERLCPEAAQVLTEETTSFVTDDRPADFFAERRLIDRFPEVTTSVLLAQGFRDDMGHVFQESAAWHALSNAPKRQIAGTWGHSFPSEGLATLDPAWEHHDWRALLFAWLDFWLKGIGEPTSLRLGNVDYQDNTGGWRSSSAWPPAEARSEVLYLAGGALKTSPAPGSRSFRSAPNLLNSYRGMQVVEEQLQREVFPAHVWDALCPSPATHAAGTSGLVYQTSALAEPVLVAGNPFAYLDVSSDLAEGLVTLNLVDVGPDFSCDPAGEPRDVRRLSAGAADLRHHDGAMRGHPFPVNRRTHVRVDLFDIAETILPGHRLALVASYGETHAEWMSRPSYPRITLHAGDAEASQLVLPIVSGSFGGPPPSLTYPPRPFVPAM